MTGVVEENISQVSSVLVDTRRLAFERPVVAWGPNTGACFEASAAFPLHVVDHGFSANVVADEILVTGEQEDVDSRFDEARQEVDRGAGVWSENPTNIAITLLPAFFLGWVDVQRLENIWSSEVGLDLLEIWWPAHSARVVLLQADVVLIHTFPVFRREIQELLKNKLARGNADLVLCSWCF